MGNGSTTSREKRVYTGLQKTRGLVILTKAKVLGVISRGIGDWVIFVAGEMGDLLVEEIDEVADFRGRRVSLPENPDEKSDTFVQQNFKALLSYK